MQVYVESGAGMFRADATAAWSFDLPYWGIAGQGSDEASALSAMEVATGVAGLTVAERIHGDEQAFALDRRPATPGEYAMTRCLLDAAREETLRLVTSASPAELDWDDPARRLPDWASWRTPRQLAWHIADTESRYYLAGLDLPTRPRAGDLVTELRESHVHVRHVLDEVQPDRSHHGDGEEWTTVKLLRRLAWHEAGELVVLRRLLVRARCALP